MASTSCVNKTPFPIKEAASNFHLYPAPLAKYDDIVANPKLFISTLEKLHASMGTKFMYVPLFVVKPSVPHILFYYICGPKSLKARIIVTSCVEILRSEPQVLVC